MEAQTVRNTIRELLPNYILQPQPRRGIIFVTVLVPATIALAWIIFHYSPPWYVAFLLTIVISQIYTVGGYIAHEALHGAIFKSILFQDILGFIGFIPFLISPTLWRFWHCQCHHGFTNSSERDPDFVATLEKFLDNPLIRWRTMFSPGSHHWISYIGMFCLFSLEAQYVLWSYGSDSSLIRKFHFNSIRAKIETLIMLLFWIFVGWSIGFKASLYIIILPMLLANFTQVSYIMTQHFLQPENSIENNPFQNTISVITHPLINFIHLNFGYHLEHHLFPTMSSKFAPMVSQVLRDHYGERYLRLPFFKVLGCSLKTSRIYFDSETLVNPYSRKKVKIVDLRAKMMR